jgi:hypothetical protein
MLMKKIILIMICFLALLSGCRHSNSNVPDSSYGEAYEGMINLIIIGVDFQEFLVKTNEEDREDEQDKGIWYTVNASTELVNQRNKTISFYDLRVGSEVRVWGGALSLLSNPPRTAATKLIL